MGQVGRLSLRISPQAISDAFRGVFSWNLLEGALCAAAVAYASFAASPPERIIAWVLTFFAGTAAFAKWQALSWHLRILLIACGLIGVLLGHPLPLAVMSLAAVSAAGSVSAGSLAVPILAASLLTLMRQTLVTLPFDSKILTSVWEAIRIGNPEVGKQVPNFSAVYCLVLALGVIVMLARDRQFRPMLGVMILFGLIFQLPQGLFTPIPFLIVSAYVVSSHSKTVGAGPSTSGRIASRTALVLLAAGVIALILPVATTKPMQRVEILGGTRMALFRQDTFASPVTQPSFANFKLQMEARGTTFFEARESKDLLKSEGIDTLLIVNPIQAIDSEVQGRIKKFVEGGGQLVLLTDHTDIGGVLAPTNSYLAFTNTRALNDSAIPHIARWSWMGRAWSSPDYFPDDDRIWGVGFGIGCSLKAKWPARPILIGTDGFSDIGDASAGASHLGNLATDPKEQDGFNVLGTVEHIGQGRAVVLGDTSSFQTSSTLKTASPWIRMLEYREYSFAPMLRLGGALLLGIAILIMLLGVRVPLLGPSLLLVLFSTHGFWSPFLRDKGNPLEVKKEGKFVAIHDYSASLMSKRAAEADLSTFVEISNVDGYPVMPELSPGGIRPKVILVTALARPIRESEVATILKDVENGATLLISAGYAARPALTPLIQRLGLDVKKIRLGHGGDTRYVSPPPALRQQSPAFREAWALDIQGKSDWFPLATGLGMVPIASRRFGQGRILWISDSRFFETENLGKEGKIIHGNVAFLRWVLSTSSGEAF